eukprot:7383022-Prymnesium_polylepis.1
MPWTSEGAKKCSASVSLSRSARSRGSSLRSLPSDGQTPEWIRAHGHLARPQCVRGAPSPPFRAAPARGGVRCRRLRGSRREAGVETAAGMEAAVKGVVVVMAAVCSERVEATVEGEDAAARVEAEALQGVVARAGW